LLVAAGSLANAVPAAGAQGAVSVVLNRSHLLSAHAHASVNESQLRSVRGPQRLTGIEQACVSFNEIQRILGGHKHLNRRGANLDAVMLGAGIGAALRVQRLGRVSARLHPNGQEEEIPLLDLVRAMGAKIVQDGYERINLVLDSPPSAAILAPVETRRR
jgi:hypothetical protein